MSQDVSRGCIYVVERDFLGLLYIFLYILNSLQSYDNWGAGELPKYTPSSSQGEWIVWTTRMVVKLDG